MAKTAMGISITTVSTEAQAPLGFIHVEPASVGAGYGDKTYIYVKNVGAALAAGEMASRGGGGATTYEVTKSGATEDDLVVGAAQVAIPQNSFGFLLRKGRATVTGGVGALGDTATTAAAGASAVLAALAIGATGIGNYLAADVVNLNCRG